MSLDIKNTENEILKLNNLSNNSDKNEENENEDELQLTNSKTVLESENNNRCDDEEDEDDINNNNNEEDDNYDYYDDYDNEEDDNHHNHYLSDGIDDDDHDENNIYLNDPEHFDYESYPLNKLDWIVERKCEKIFNYLNLNDPLDAIYILKQFTWNYQKIIEMYDKDKQLFLKTYFSDNNNNNSKTIPSDCDKTKFTSFINIFANESNFFDITKSLLFNENNQIIKKKPQVPPDYCEICCCKKSSTNLFEEMLSLNECMKDLHYFCIDCWYMHFEYLIKSSNTSSLECMQTKCNKIANKDFVLRCLNKSSLNSAKSTTLIERYKKLVAIDLIKDSEDLQMCPGEITVSISSQNNHNNQISSSMQSLLMTTPTSSSQMTSFSLSTPKSAPAFASYRSSMSSSPQLNNSSFLNSSNSIETTLNSTMNKDTSTVSSSVTTITKKCDQIVWIKSKPASRRVLCSSCQTQYCFMCLLPYHAPNSCQTIRKWNMKCQDDSETRNYLLVHTQDCPKCKVCIEKNGGCSHMTCNRCKHEFCWVCLNDWKTHGATYDCNRYKGNPEQDNAREALNRYTHYYHRWINHANSLKLEKEFKEKCRLKVNEKIMNKGGGTMVDWEFFFEAVDTLTRARYTLQYTYPYAYFLENNESKLLFENIQAELEREVENLSHSLEKVNLNDQFNIKTQMNIVEKRRKTLLKDFIE